MKKLLYIIIALLSLSSCKDYLDRPSLDQFDESNFWTSEGNIRLFAHSVYLQNNQYHLRIELAESEDKSSLEAKAIMCKAGVDEILAVTPINQGVLELTLSLKVQGLYADAVLCCDGVEQIVAAKVSIRNLSTEVAGGFVGCTTGVYAVWKDMPSQLRESCTITQLSYRADV